MTPFSLFKVKYQKLAMPHTVEKKSTLSPFTESSELFLSDELLSENLKVLADKNQETLAELSKDFGKFNRDNAAGM